MSSYSDLILSDNPVAYYRLDEATGAVTAVDFTGNNNAGTYTGSTITYAKPGAIFDGDTAVQFALNSDMSTLPTSYVQTFINGTRLSTTSQMTAECWVSVTSNPPPLPGNPGDGGKSAIVNCGAQGSGFEPLGFAIYLDGNGHPHFNILCEADFALHDATWAFGLSAGFHHLVGTFDGNNVRLYVDGVLRATVTTSNSAIRTDNGTGTPASPVAIGAWSKNTYTGTTSNSSQDYGQFIGVIDEVALYGYPLTPTQVQNHYNAAFGPLPPAPTYSVVNDERHYFLVQVWDKTGTTLLDLPQADIDSFELQDLINGGSGPATLVFRRGFNAIGQVAYLNRVLVWIWHGKIARPANPYWSGYMVDIDQEQTVTTGKITVHLEGDQKQLDRGIVSEKINPLIAGNPSLDAGDYIRHLLTTYAPPGFATYSVPSTMFPLLPLQFTRQKLGSVIDTTVKTGRDNLGQFWTWRVASNYQLRRTFTIQPDQNPNKIGGLTFKHIFKNEMCSKYSISTKYRDIVNVVLVEGAQDPNTGQQVSAVYEDGASVSSYDPWEDAISVPALVNNDACQAFGEAYLDIHANPQAQGQVELWKPDPDILSGTWLQCWENASTIKQVRVGSVRVSIKPTRIIQTLDLTAPTPYLDEAVYKLGMNVQGAISSMTRRLSVNTQQNYVRLGGTASAGP